MGNTAAASIPLALADVDLPPGTRVLLSAFGGAGAWGAVALKWPRQ
jgi:3-oxoacyl-[acyl-carrier-protein] synthase-3